MTLEHKRKYLEAKKNLKKNLSYISPNLWLERFQETINDIREWYQYIISKNQSFISGLEEKFGSQNDYELREDINSFKKEAIKSGKYNSDEFLRLETIYQALNLRKSLIDYEIRLELDSEEIRDNAEDLCNAYLLGLSYGLSRAAAIIEDSENPMFQAFHRAFRACLMKETRWASRNEKYESALAHAEMSWEEGDELLHHEMVKYILSMDSFKELNKQRLLKEIKPIAQKYGKFWNPNEKKISP